jgi:hypothetical protein
MLEMRDVVVPCSTRECRSSKDYLRLEPSEPAVHFQRKVWWFTPVPHRFIEHVKTMIPMRSPEPVLKFGLLLGKNPSLAYLWQHRVGGRALFPGAAMFEAAYAAAQISIGDCLPVPYLMTMKNIVPTFAGMTGLAKLCKESLPLIKWGGNEHTIASNLQIIYAQPFL